MNTLTASTFRSRIKYARTCGTFRTLSETTKYSYKDNHHCLTTKLRLLRTPSTSGGCTFSRLFPSSDWEGKPWDRPIPASGTQELNRWLWPNDNVLDKILLGSPCYLRLFLWTSLDHFSLSRHWSYIAVWRWSLTLHNVFHTEFQHSLSYWENLNTLVYKMPSRNACYNHKHKNDYFCIIYS